MSDRLTSDEVERLRRYMPPGWWERVGPALTPRVLTDSISHLRALLAAVATYVPMAVLTDGRNASVGWGGFRYGTGLFADVSGFTRLTERFSQERGREGAEEVTLIINGFLQAVNSIATRYGGDLVDFAGDAALSFYEGAGHAARATRAAWEMQQVVRERFARVETSLGPFSLRMSSGLGSGWVFAARLGTPDRATYAMMGPALTAMTRAQSLARAGQMLIDATTRDLAGGAIVSVPAKEGCFKLSEARPYGGTLPSPDLQLAPPAGSPPAMLRWLLQRLDSIAPFLLPGLLEKLVLSSRVGGIESDHRWVTTLFADLRGINDLIRALGSERVSLLTRIVNRYFLAMRDVMDRYEGVLHKVEAGSAGPRFLTTFGAPGSHADDPERAVRTALDMQEALAEVNREARALLGDIIGGRCWPGPRLAVGITTGFVFAGSVGSAERREYTVLGEEVNLAQRLMSVAAEGKALIAASTASHLSPRVATEEMPPVWVKGKSVPVRHFLVQGLVDGTVLRERAGGELVGREAALAHVVAALDQAVQGDGQVLVVHGEAGVGKTRLVLEAVREAGRRGLRVFSGQCVSFLRDTVPYLPWADILRGLLGVPCGGTPEEQDAALAMRMAAAGLAGWEPLVGDALGLSLPDTPLTASLDPRLRQQRFFDVVVELIVHYTRRRSLLLWLDDLQWVDTASLGLLDHVVRNVRGLPVLLVLAHRPTEGLSGRWRGLPHVGEVWLSELGEEERGALLARLLGVRRAPEPVARSVLSRSQGNPLFIEELVRALIEAGVLRREVEGWAMVANPETAGVPDTVQGIIQSRLDGLAETERRVLQVASVAGQSFTVSVLDGVYPYDDLDGTLMERLRLLTARRYLTPVEPPADYAFRHAMIQEVAYESLPHARRRALHRAVARFIEETSMEENPERLELIALHYYRGREWRKALPYLLMAGQRTQREYTNEAAINHFERALRAAEQLDEPCEEERLAAHKGLGQVLAILGQYDEALEHLDQAWAIVEAWPPSLERDHSQAELCRETAGLLTTRGDYRVALEWLEQGLGLSGVEKTAGGAGLYLMGAGVFHRQGDNQRAREWCLRGLQVADQLDGGERGEILARGNYLLGTILHTLGEVDEAVERCRRSLELYEGQGDLLGRAQAHNNLGMVYHDLGEWTLAIEQYVAAMQLAERIGYAEGRARVATNLGEVYLTQGRLDDAEQAYQSALEIAEQRGMTYGVALLHNNLGAVCLREGKWQEAEEHLSQSFALFEEIGSEEFLPELYRHRAEVALERGDVKGALDDARRSLECARVQRMELEEGPAWRVMGQAWLAQGELDQAEEALSRALAAAVAVENQYEAARARLHLARLQLLRGQETSAIELARQAAHTFIDLGAQLDLRETDAVLREAEGGKGGDR